MAEKIIMPKVAMSMEEGTIVEWHVKEGDTVSKGDIIAEIETDKSLMALESDYDGTIIKILYKEGASVPVITTIAWIGNEGEEVSEDKPKMRATPAERRKARGQKLSDSDKNKNLSGDNNKTIKLTNIKKITSDRMLKSHSEIPPVTESIVADVTELLALRKEFNESQNTRITINDLVMFAVVKALKNNPDLNSVFNGDSIIQKHDINLGMAVSTERGLLVPVIKNANNYSVSELSIAAKKLSEDAKSGELSASDLEGGTFTVTNLGMYGITFFTPIINPPEAGILGVCSIEEHLKMIDGEIQNRQIMGLSLTFDHRITDGAGGAVFLKDLCEVLEEPKSIFV
ncbi:MAG: dihydrolipoamide acetyltransferase family protein [Spirochaetales bacterium]|nr:dihydrolipoamide acetyltransferase family protein [Spirochaetales bacterium]